ncbi:MAG: aminotransferase class V-fold PLP-dependent enzyme [Ignavibacteria bacterium]|nr:aminotransferase class V-fold PLP-dependent enzyme [Ignavibacteria bacterium]
MTNKSNPQINIYNIRDHLIGINKKVTVLDGTEKQYIFFDNAASTPTFSFVKSSVDEILEWYSGVHRGAGIKSLIATKAYDDSRKIVADFVRADLSTNTVIFGKNTTDGVNKLAYRLNLSKEDVVICSLMDHHSNDLPWRKFASVIHSGINKDGSLDLNDLNKKVEKYKERLKLIAITGAANVTGIINPIHEIAEIAHKNGAKILIDAAQLAPHRAIDIKPDNDIQHIDFIVFSAHKMYAPFGTGVLIGPRSVFEEGDPEFVGGGTVNIVTEREVHWTHLPDKEEAGTPNLIGAVALASAMKVLDEIGMDKVEKHEIELTKYAYDKITKIPEINILGPSKFISYKDKLGVLTFNVDRMHNSLVASILCFEGGIGVRDGCFCAHPYIKHLLGVTEEESKDMIKNIQAGDRMNLPGAVRASFGIYNTIDEIDLFLEMLHRIVKKDFKGKYIQDKITGAYFPEGFEVDYQKYFSLV